MSLQQTLSIIKPDATRRQLTGAIVQCFEGAGLRIIAQKRLQMTREQAKKFYNVHRERAFFDSLCTFMASGPIVIQVLEGDNSVEENRRIMGATNPVNAEHTTIRKKFGLSIEENSVHGSDSLENAAWEISFFFAEIEIIGSNHKAQCD